MDRESVASAPLLIPFVRNGKSHYERPSGASIDGRFELVEDTEPTLPQKTPRYRLLLLWKITIYGLALSGLIALTHRALQSLLSNGSISCDCGSSTAEAIAMGCKYDLLASAWLPEQCRDEELVEEFNQAGPGPGGAWDYYSDSNGTKVTTAEISLYADIPGARYWTTYEWHVLHCVFYWRKQFRSRFTKRKVEERYDNEGHIKHCGNLFLSDFFLDSIATVQGAALVSDYPFE